MAHISPMSQALPGTLKELTPTYGIMVGPPIYYAKRKVQVHMSGG